MSIADPNDGLVDALQLPALRMPRYTHHAGGKRMALKAFLDEDPMEMPFAAAPIAEFVHNFASVGATTVTLIRTAELDWQKRQMYVITYGGESLLMSVDHILATLPPNLAVHVQVPGEEIQNLRGPASITVPATLFAETRGFVQRIAFEHSPDVDDDELAEWARSDRDDAQTICRREGWPIEVDDFAREEGFPEKRWAEQTQGEQNNA